MAEKRYLYVTRYEETLFKIGCSENPERRLKALPRFHGHRAREVMYTREISSKYWFGVEACAHEALSYCRYGKTEMFHCTINAAIAAVDLAIARQVRVLPETYTKAVDAKAFIKATDRPIPDANNCRFGFSTYLTEQAFSEALDHGINPLKVFDDTDAGRWVKVMRDGDVCVMLCGSVPADPKTADLLADYSEAAGMPRPELTQVDLHDRLGKRKP